MLKFHYHIFKPLKISKKVIHNLLIKLSYIEKIHLREIKKYFAKCSNIDLN